ncbi:hypothetical protein RIU45_00310 [Riemerella anatipestifer]|nr:hypothetical protein [Riemerella anatipestifer]
MDNIISDVLKYIGDCGGEALESDIKNHLIDEVNLDLKLVKATMVRKKKIDVESKTGYWIKL